MPARRPRIDDAMYGEYEAKCSHPGCSFRQVFEEAGSVGYQVGSAVIPDPGSGKGICQRCKRQSMIIMKVPPPPEPKKPTGFWKIPEE